MLDRTGSSASTGRGPSVQAAASSSIPIPMIPGLVSTQRHFIGRTNFHKGQLLEQMVQGRVRLDATAAGTKPPSASITPLAKSNQTQVASSTAPNRPSSKFRSDATQPKWITHDRQVLRFFGYFLEPLLVETHSSSTRQDRVRRIVLLFYLSDHSLAISEPRVPNSGLAQGEFMKRTAATKPSGEPFTPEDFSVGGCVALYGRRIYLIDCDEATRAFYDEALGQPQGSPRKYPDDDTSSSQRDEVEQLKQRLREKAAAAAESKSEKVRKFHELSQRVLRFFVSWQDPHPLYPETRKYVLHYFLCDDTVELVEPKPEREGRGHFAVLLSRRRVASDGRKDRFLGERDLRCGDFVQIFSRRFLLEDCDAFTREYYLETHGMTQEKCEPEQASRRQRAAKWKVFQVDAKAVRAQLGGLGENEQPSRAHQFFENESLEKKQLRFRARFHGLRASDANAQREFVLTFFLEDDTLAVFEPRVKNSGVVGGRFLDRGRFRKCCELQDGGTSSREQDKDRSAYKASDFFVGAVVSFEFAPQQKLELIEADRQTLSFCESHPERFPFSDADAVLTAIAKAVDAKKLTSLVARRAFRGADSSDAGVLAVADVRRALDRLGLVAQLNAQQLVTLCRKFEDRRAGPGDANGPQPFVYDDFCDAVASRVVATTASDVYERLSKCSALRRLLREADDRHERVVDATQLSQVARAYKIALLNGDLQVITTKFGVDHRQRRGVVDYNALCDRVFDGPAAETQERRRERQHTDDGRDENQFSLRRGDHDVDDEGDFDCGGSDAGDACLPDMSHERLPSPRRRQQSDIPTLALATKPDAKPSHRDAPLAGPRGDSTPPAADARVVGLLRRVFGARKYVLRKALRDRDTDKSGFLGEEAFMAAVLSVEPTLSDDDTYLIADVYFPTNNSHVDYGKLLEGAFRC